MAHRDKGKERDREKERLRDADAERRRAIRADYEASDTDDDLEWWTRRPYRTSRRAAERKRRRAQEEAEDGEDRAQEARERAARGEPEPYAQYPTSSPAHRSKRSRGSAYDQQQQQPQHDGDAHAVSANGRPDGEAPEAVLRAGDEGEQHLAQQAQQQAPTEPDFDPHDPIYRAMIAAAAQAPEKARPPPQQQQEVAPQQQQSQEHALHRHALQRQSPQPQSPPYSHAPAAAAAGAGAGRSRAGGRTTNAVAAMFMEEEEVDHRRALKPIQYTDEELRAVHEPDPLLDPVAAANAAVAALNATLAAGGKYAHAAAPAPAAAAAPAPVAAAAAAVPKAAAPAEDPKAAMRRLMDGIPTQREGVFNYSIKWDAYSSSMGEKVKGWVSAKVKELMGMPEPTLVEYVVKLLGQHKAPADLYDELQPVLDTDTESFVIKLYRMVIYETEKAVLGL